MAEAKARRIAMRTYERVAKELDLARIDQFRRADLTAELRQKTGLTEEDEHRLTVVAELHRLGLPVEAAEALALSNALGSASELASLSIEEVERIIQEEPVKNLLPANFQIDRVMIEDWMRLVVPLTADEAAPGRSAASEAETTPLARDEDSSHAAEEPALSKEDVRDLLTSLQQSWDRTHAAVKKLTDGKGVPVDADTLIAALSDLQTGLGSALNRLAAPTRAEFDPVDEDAAAPAADELLDPSDEIVLLQRELRRVEATIDALRMVGESGSEEKSPAAATEEGGGESETSARGE